MYTKHYDELLYRQKPNIYTLISRYRDKDIAYNIIVSFKSCTVETTVFNKRHNLISIFHYQTAGILLSVYNTTCCFHAD